MSLMIQTVETLKPGDLISFRMSGDIRYRVLRVEVGDSYVRMELRVGDLPLTANYRTGERAYMHERAK